MTRMGGTLGWALVMGLAGLGSTNPDTSYAAKMESAVEEKAVKLHKIDAFNLMIFVCLLILTVFTVYLFKHRRCRFLHETGVTLIYGLVVGMIIHFAVPAPPDDTVTVLPKNTSEVISGPPTYLRMRVATSGSEGGSEKDAGNGTGTFHYKIVGRFYGDESEASESVVAAQMTFSPEIFFNILLPPIIFNAGYSLKRKNFFRNIGTIMVLAFFGTTISCVVVGYIAYGVAQAAGLSFITAQESLFFGALISATDPVTTLAVFSDMGVEPDLFAVCFGESALNDAVAIVLTQTIERYTPATHDHAAHKEFTFGGLVGALGNFAGVFCGSFLLGAAVALATALVTKFSRITEYPLLESALFFLMSYLSFLAAEASNMTGIVAVLFCGMLQAHYTFNNLSQDSKLRTKQFFEIMNFLSESFIFTYIGVSLFTSEAHLFSAPFIFGAFFAIAVGRAIFIYPLGLLMNLRRKPKLPMAHLHMLFFSGLRGAIAFALAIRNTANHARQIIYTTTSIIVIFTVIFNGGFAQQMVVWLGIRHGADGENSEELSPTTDLPLEAAASNGTHDPTADDRHKSQGSNPWDKALLPRKWYNFDARFMKPLLTHSRPNLMETMPAMCLPLARLLTSTEQLSAHASHGGGGAGAEDDDLVFDSPTAPHPNLSRSVSEWSPRYDAARESLLSPPATDEDRHSPAEMD